MIFSTLITVVVCFSPSWSWAVRRSLPLPETSKTKSPNMGRLVLLLMTLDSAASLLESAVLDTVNFIKKMGFRS